MILQCWPRERLTPELGSGMFLFEIQGESADFGGIAQWLGEVLETSGMKLTPGALLLLVSVPGS